jgi:hypothetical protein
MSLSVLYSMNSLTIRFGEAGDVLEMHSHPEGNYHDTLLIEGEAEIYGPDRKWVAQLTPGKLLVLTDEQMEHEIRALTPGALVINLYRQEQLRFKAQAGKGWQS